MSSLQATSQPSLARSSPRPFFRAAALFVVVSFAGIGGWLLTHPGVTEPFMPHRTCYLNSAPLIWLHVSSDFLIGAAYVAISSTLAYLVARARHEIPFRWMMLAFAVFIVACGATHWMEVWTVWTPRYWLAGSIKLVTAIASVAVALVLPLLVPKVLALLQAARVSSQRKMELEAANTQLAALYERVKQLDELKTNFFANVSHEFRTPLTLILGPVEHWLTRSSLPERERHDLEIIRRNALILHKHVNDLLDVSKLEAGKMQLAYANVDIGRLVRIVFGYFDSAARERMTSMFVNAPESLIAQVDPEKLERVLINLFSNAMKFVPEGGRVRCTLKAENDRMVIEVEDSGPGVPPDMREAIFERFQQVESGASRRFGGTGLGLAIVKEFVELHHGTIRVGESSLGGAFFQMELPLHAPPGADVAERARLSVSALIAEPHLEMLRQETRKMTAQEPGTDQQLFESDAAVDGGEKDQRPLVLIVEDTAEMKEFLAQIFSDEFRVRTASNGREGLQKAQELTPDLIVSDVMMPEMDGHELLQKLHGDGETSNIPVLLLTAKANDSTRMELLRAGAEDYILKPFIPDELLMRARNLVAAKLVRDTLQHELTSRTHDIGQLAREIANHTRELHAAKEAAEAASRAKDHFLAVLSHELRTPLTPVLIAISNLRSREPSGELRDVLGMVQRNVELEARLIDDLLDLTRVSRGKLQLNLETANLHDLLQHALAISESDLTRKRLSVSTEFNAQKPFIRADSGRMLQVLWNVLQNAIKFTPENGRIIARTSDADNDTSRIEITDTGIGIEQAVLPKIFDAFEQGETSVTRRYGGLGLGLAVTRGLVEAHGGKIFASSPGKDQGTTITIDLDAVEKLVARESDHPISSEPLRRKELRILLVEDHEDTRAALIRLLTKWGYHVEPADTVKGGLEKFEAAKGDFDLLISDIGLPDANGTDLMRELRKHSTIPGIAVSGFGMEQDVEGSMQAGFNEHLTKPVPAQKLKAVIESVTSRPGFS